MKYTAYALFFFGLVFLSEMSAQTVVRTAVLTSLTPSTDARGRLVANKGQHSICFRENGAPCGNRPPDLLYGFMGTFDEPDWFMNSGEYPVRTKMRNLGPHKWEDKIELPTLEPYPELKPSESRETTVEFAVEDSTNLPVSSTVGISNDRVFIPPRKILNTSDNIHKVIEGNMYLIRVRDNLYDFKVLMRVDKVNRGKSVSISWKALLPQ